HRAHSHLPVGAVAPAGPLLSFRALLLPLCDRLPLDARALARYLARGAAHPALPPLPSRRLRSAAPPFEALPCLARVANVVRHGPFAPLPDPRPVPPPLLRLAEHFRRRLRAAADPPRARGAPRGRTPAGAALRPLDGALPRAHQQPRWCAPEAPGAPRQVPAGRRAHRPRHHPGPSPPEPALH